MEDGGSSTLSIVLGIVAYVYVAYSLMTIANKTEVANSWMAWVPILNVILMLKVAGKPLWWILLFLIPLVNIIIGIIIWMRIAEARNKPGWWGILLIIPVVNIVVLGLIAFKD